MIQGGMTPSPSSMTIEDFTIIEEKDRIPYITFKEIQMKMPREMYITWCSVSRGSTSYLEGVYQHDLEKFLRLYNQGK